MPGGGEPGDGFLMAAARSPGQVDLEVIVRAPNLVNIATKG